MSSLITGKSSPYLKALLLAFFCVLTLTLKAHQVEQFYADYSESTNTIIIQFDVAYAIPETRDNPSTSQPKRTWLLELPPEQHASLRAEAEHYLRGYLELHSGTNKIHFDISFPDFDSSPPHFINLLNQGAYYRIKLSPREQSTEAIKPRIIHPESPNLLLAQISGDTISYTTINAPSQYTPAEATTSPNSTPHSSTISLGFRHVIPDGLDHILFIIGICLTASTLRQLLWLSISFTIAHAISMALIISGVLPIYNYSGSAYIEPLIALSIAFIAAEVIIQKTNLKYRYLIIAIFGLIHGCGFAGSLGSSLQSLDSDNWITSLVIANIGIELAQALLVVTSYVLLHSLRKVTYLKLYEQLTKATALSIMITGLIWFFQRLH